MAKVKVAIYRLYEVEEADTETETLERARQKYVDDLRVAINDERKGALFSFNIDLVENIGKNKEDK